jgi:hypothetical protein
MCRYSLRILQNQYLKMVLVIQYFETLQLYFLLINHICINHLFYNLTSVETIRHLVRI